MISPGGAEVPLRHPDGLSRGSEMHRHAEERVLAQIDRGFEAYIDDIRAAIRQPSVSKTGEGLAEMAEWVAAYIRRLGGTARLVSGREAPIVEGDLRGPAAPTTLLFYDLYDVQPANPVEWQVPPFAAETVSDGAGGSRLVGRGAFNSKGPMVGFLAVLRAFRESDVPMPVNIRFLIEGEEEIGSPSLEPYIRANIDTLRRCDAAFIPYLGTNSRGQTPIRLGFKGLMMLEFSVEGGAWGGPAERNVHAMHTAWIGNPGWELLTALATLQTQGGRLAIDGLDDTMHEPDAEVRQLVAAAVDAIDPAVFLDEQGARRFKYDCDPRELLTRFLFDPTINVDGIWVGDTPLGTEPPTQMARRASAIVDIRLVPGMTVDETVRCLRRHLDRRGFEHVAFRVKSAYPAARCSPREPVVAALIDACRKHAEDVVVFPMHAGAAPMYLFSEVIGIPFAFGGLGHGLYPHAPGEFLSIESMRGFLRSMASFLFAFAGRSGC